MPIIAKLIVGFIAIAHLYIMWFEMFQWVSRGPRIFEALPKEIFEPTKAMAANQGLYNGFLAAGLLWSLTIQDLHWQSNVAICFLLFVLIAGIYGALTVSKKILYVQTLPAIVGVAAVLWL